MCQSTKSEITVDELIPQVDCTLNMVALSQKKEVRQLWTYEVALCDQ